MQHTCYHTGYNKHLYGTNKSNQADPLTTTYSDEMVTMSTCFVVSIQLQRRMFELTRNGYLHIALSRCLAKRTRQSLLYIPFVCDTPGIFICLIASSMPASTPTVAHVDYTIPFS